VAGIDRKTTRFGWREFAIRGAELQLNGEAVHLVGDICHPFGPYMFSREFVQCWYGLIKEVGGNAVRLHAQIYPSFFLEVADEMGLAVLDETGFFGSNLAANLEEPAIWPRLEAHYDGLVLRDRNHPSVFGWSFGNELFAFFLYDDAAARDQDIFYEKIIAFGQRAKALDPTRNFITCDGDQDLRGTLPVWSKHFGHGVHPLPEDTGKPIVIGESGGTYYARPSQFAEFNGEESFRSYAGRNHALGIDVYQNVRHMVKKLCYFSPSELVWFGLEPLPYGYHDYSRLPNEKDGIFFEKPEEGHPGLWFERLPPFAGTLNAGFDPALPAYRPLDMFYGMKDALTFDSRWDSKWAPDVPVLPAPPVYATTRTVRLVGDRAGATACALTAMGLRITKEGTDIVIDAATATAEEATAALAENTTVLVLVGDTLPAWLPAELTLTDRTATQLDRGSRHPFVDSLAIGDMYTAEEREDKLICRHGLDASALGGARVLLAAGEADWSQFNNVEERVKCGAAFLYEKLHKPAGGVLVKLPRTGDHLLCTASTTCSYKQCFGTI
ncbi:MAG: beta-galactosidase, partial [Clostridia bacterium]|nr:beta-galactosidase [Clostridia bacterium]